jgi:hypothetical protein
VLVLQVVLHVTHLVVSRQEVIQVDSRALFYPVKKYEMFVICTWICSLLVDQRLIPVLDEILHVPHLVVSREQVVHIGPSALFDPAQ